MNTNTFITHKNELANKATLTSGNNQKFELNKELVFTK